MEMSTQRRCMVDLKSRFHVNYGLKTTVQWVWALYESHLQCSVLKSIQMKETWY